MNVVFDTLASPQNSGGMRLHAREVMNSWIEEYPEDNIVIIGPKWTRTDVAVSARVRHVIWPNEKAPLRIVGEMVVVPAITRVFLRSYVLLSLSPVLSPISPRSRAYVVSHDWRHINNPHEFTALERLYRSVWSKSLRWARAVFAISPKTAAEIREIEPQAPVVVIPNGRDHARRWVPIAKADQRGPRERPLIVTFGHKNHKRPELAIEALSGLQNKATLVVLGATGEYRARLIELAREFGVQEQCRFPGFVDESTYQRTTRSASIVLLLATDDGFGLPIAEADYFGIHSIVTTDGGLASLHPNAVQVKPNAQDLTRVIDELLRTPGYPSKAPKWTWRNTIMEMRAVVESDRALSGRDKDEDSNDKSASRIGRSHIRQWLPLQPR